MARASCCGACAGAFRSSKKYSPMRDTRDRKWAKAIAASGSWTIEIVKRTDLHRFVVVPKRWIVERTFAWISRNRRLARDFERYATTVAAFVRLAMIRLMLKRLTKPSPCS